MKPCLIAADSERFIRELYEEYFTQLGYRVETAADGLECVDLLRRCQPEVAVIDLELSWGGSDGVFAMLRDFSLPSVPVIIATGDDESSKMSQRTHLPMDCCFQKPFAFNLLSRQIQMLTSQLSAEPVLAS